MEKFILSNGVICVVTSGATGEFTLSATVKVGHINEPKQGLAAVYEKVMMLQSDKLQAVYGGTITSYLTGGKVEDFGTCLEKLAQLIIKPKFSVELLDEAVTDIIRHTKDRDVLPRRQLKLLYKHKAFNGGVVWNTEAYINSLLSITVDDLQKLHEVYYTGKNLIIGVSGIALGKLKHALEQAFACLPMGEECETQLPKYTGGYGVLSSKGNFQRLLMGWDASALSNVAEANVMMSMLAGRLERSFADAGMDVVTEVKIAGYYGCRTLRVAVESVCDVQMKDIVDIVCKNIHRLKYELASERRMETSRNRAMTEKLFKFGQPEAASVEIAWQLLGKGRMYDVDERINATWLVSDRDVQDIANFVFSTPLTCVVAARGFNGNLDEILAKMK